MQTFHILLLWHHLNFLIFLADIHIILFFFLIPSITCSLLQILFLFQISDCVGPDGSPKQVRTDTWHMNCVYMYMVHVLYG